MITEFNLKENDAAIKKDIASGMDILTMGETLKKMRYNASHLHAEDELNHFNQTASYIVDYCDNNVLSFQKWPLKSNSNAVSMTGLAYDEKNKTLYAMLFNNETNTELGYFPIDVTAETQRFDIPTIGEIEISSKEICIRIQEVERHLLI